MCGQQVLSRQEEREQVPLNMILPPGTSEIGLNQVVNLWANEEAGQFLYGTPDCLILHLQRFQLQEGMWTKRSRAVDVPQRLMVPFSLNGVQVEKAWYRPVALVLHQGHSHENGNAYSQIISELTQQHAQRALQVWLVLDPSDEMEDTTPKRPALLWQHSYALCQCHLLWTQSAGLGMVQSRSHHLSARNKKRISMHRSSKKLNNTSLSVVGKFLALLPLTLVKVATLEAFFVCIRHITTSTLSSAMTRKVMDGWPLVSSQMTSTLPSSSST